MGPSRLTLILGTILLFVLIALFSLRFLGVPKIVNSVVLFHLKPLLGDNASLQSIDIRLGGLILNGLEYNNKQTGMRAEISQVRVNWNLFNSIIYGLKPLYLVEEVTVDSWKVEYHLPDNYDSADRESRIDFWSLPHKYPALKKVTLNDGAVITRYASLQRLNIWLDLSSKGKLRFDLSSAALNDSVNLRITGKALIKEKKLNAQLNLDNADARLISGLEEKLAINGGIIRSDLKFSLLDREFEVEGDADIADISICIANKFDYSSDKISIQVKNDTLISAGEGNFSGLELQMKSVLIDFSHPYLDLNADAAKVDLSILRRKFFPEIAVSGEGAASASVSGRFNSLAVKYQFNSPEVKYEDFIFRKLKTSGRYRADTLSVDRLSFNSFGGAVKGRGSMFMQDNPYLKFNAEYAGIPDLKGILKDEISLPLDSLYLKGNIEGKISDLKAKAAYSLVTSYEIARLHGAIDYSDSLLKITEASGEGESIVVDLKLESNRPIFSLAARNAHKLIPENIWPEPLRGRQFEVDVFAGGAMNDFDFFLGIETSEIGLNLDASLTLDDTIATFGKYTVFLGDSIQAGGEFDAGLAGDTLYVKNISAGPDFYLTGKYNIFGKYISEGRIRSEDWGVDTLLQYLGYDRWQEFGGLLKLEVDVKGDIRDPEIEFSAHVSNGIIFNTPGYWFSSAGILDKKILRFVSLDFGNRGAMLFRGRGSYNTIEQDLDFRASLDKVDFNLLVNSFIGKTGLVTGEGGYTIHAGGTLKEPLIEAGFRIGSGTITGIQFDRFTGAVKYGIAGKNGANFEIPSLKLSKDGQYDAIASGSIPLEGGSLNAKLDVEGNILSILSGMTNAVTKAEGRGLINLVAGGTLQNPVIESASASIQRGSISFNQIVQKIEKFELNAVLEDNFVKIVNLSGEIDKVPFAIESHKEINTAGGSLEPLVLGNGAVNLGIISLKTGREGLKLRIPGIIPPGETARLNAEGRAQGEMAYIAGPVSRPLVRGKLIVRDGVIYYPPPKKNRDPNRKPNPVNEFIKKINWDIEVVPDRGNTYERDMSGLTGTGSQIIKDFSGLFSRMTVDMDIDRRLEGMTMRGAIKNDSTFSITGGFISTRGTINFLDLDFRVQQFKIEFDPSDNKPWVEGHANTVQKDSLGIDRTIILRVVHLDPVTNEKTYRAKWGEFTFILEDDLGNSQEQILGILGFAPDNLTDKATTLPLRAVDNAVFGTWLTRIEKEIKNVLGVDYINIDPALAQNILAEQLATADGDTAAIDWRTRYLRYSRFTVGKYITDDLFFTYSGRFDTGESPLDHRERLGIIHNWNLEFRLPTSGANLLMVVGYEYDGLEEKNDKSLSIKYTFNF